MSPTTRTGAAGPRAHDQLTFAVLIVSVSAFALLQSLVTPVLAQFQTEFGTDQSTATWVLTAYLLSASVFTPIMGRIGDRVGKERMLVLTLVALTAGSVLAALAGTIGVMIAARVLQGIGGGVLPLSFGIIRDEFPAHRVPGAVAVLASLAAVGGGVGLVLAGPIVDGLGFRWLFWLPGIVTAVAALAAWLVVPESPVRSEGRISLLPAVLLSAWLVAFLLALSQGRGWGWDSGRVLGLFATTVVVAGAWIVVENRAASPLIDLRMMRLPAVWTTNLVALLLGFGMYAAFGFVPQFAQTPAAAGYGFGASITESGLILLPGSVAMFLVSLASPSLVRRVGAKAVVIAGSLVVAVSMAMLALAHDQERLLYLANAVLGLGMGLVFACLSNLIVAAVPPEQTGVASGMNANIRTIGGSIGAAVMASIVTADLQPTRLPTESGYTHGFLVLTGVMVLAALVALLIPALRAPTAQRPAREDFDHPELGSIAAGTVVGDESE